MDIDSYLKCRFWTIAVAQIKYSWQLALVSALLRRCEKICFHFWAIMMEWTLDQAFHRHHLYLVLTTALWISHLIPQLRKQAKRCNILPEFRGSVSTHSGIQEKVVWPQGPCSYRTFYCFGRVIVLVAVNITHRSSPPWDTTY